MFGSDNETIKKTHNDLFLQHYSFSQELNIMDFSFYFVIGVFGVILSLNLKMRSVFKFEQLNNKTLKKKQQCAEVIDCSISRELE